MVFPNLGFHVKISSLHSLTVLCLLFCAYALNTHSCLWCEWIIWSLAAKNHQHKMMLHWELSLHTQVLSPKNPKNFSQKVSSRSTMAPRKWAINGGAVSICKSIRILEARRPHHPMISRKPPRKLALSRLREQLPVSNYHRGMYRVHPHSRSSLRIRKTQCSIAYLPQQLIF